VESIALILPIDDLLPNLPLEGNTVIEAAPGAGKTTRVPAYLMDRIDGDVIVLEPRRLAARLAARRVASERGERVGESVGYQVRFEDFSGPKTRLRYMTEGVLNRRLASDPHLRGVSTVVLDEFHERHLEGDLALALLLELQRTRRKDLRIVVMSATLDAAPIAAHLGGCPILRSEGRLYPLEMRYTPESAQKLEDRVATALEKTKGDVLIFLPGAAEIRRAIEACRRSDLLLLPLYGELSTEEQDRAVEKSSQRKAIFATNIAESSITIDGVTTVIDCGLARVASDSKTTGLPQLSLSKISRASATQRAGRAARTGPGLCIRLYTEQDYLSRAERGVPEIVSRELSGLVLQLRAMGIHEVNRLPWMTPPPPEDLARAERLLDELGATGEVAREMAEMPVHPRLARMMMESSRRGVVSRAARVAALLSSGDRPQNPDLIHVAERSLSPYAEKIARQLERQVRGGREAKDWEKGLAESILAAYPDRVAKRRKGEEYTVAGGISAKLGSPLPKPSEWLVCVDLDEMSERSTVMIRAACPIEPDWLLDFPVEAIDRYQWSRDKERFEQESALVFHGLTIESSVNPRPVTPEAARLLGEKLREAGWRRFLDVEETEALLARVRFAQDQGVDVGFDESRLLDQLAALCEGRSGFDQVREAIKKGEWAPHMDHYLLDRIAPKTIPLRGKMSVKVNYVPGQPPWIESRLQDFWGIKETPKVADGKVAVLVHLLAPNRRPVQMTQDLASFWAKLYPEIRPGLSRRYPKHQWP
jgi:ATP-dependent helicase HrpB